MKKLKFLPALALMMVAVLTFAFTPAKKNVADRYLIKGASEWVFTEEPPTGCEGAGDICYLVVSEDETTDPQAIGAAAESELQNHSTDTAPYSFTYGTVFPKD